MGSTKINRVQVEAELAKVSDEFKQKHGDGSRRGTKYPAKLKELSLLFIKSGGRIGAVAALTGVSTHTIGNWQRAEKIAPPRELRIAKPLPPQSLPMTEVLVSIYFRSGIRIELPSVAMTESFLKSLQQLGCES